MLSRMNFALWAGTNTDRVPTGISNSKIENRGNQG